MRNTLVIFRKELKVYTTSPLFYVITAMFALLAAFFFGYSIRQSLVADLSSTFTTMNIVMVLFAPLLTMRLISQEKSDGTIELLQTMPLRDVELVVGKYLAALVMYLAMLSTTLVGVLFLIFTAVDKQQFLFLKIGQLDYASMALGYFGNVLFIGGFLAIGLLASTVTRNQIVAAVISFAILLVLFVINIVASFTTPPLSDIFDFLAPGAHTDAFLKGAVGLSDLVYGLSLVGVPLYLAVVSLGARRWH